jgi:hypothetical protein
MDVEFFYIVAVGLLLILFLAQRRLEKSQDERRTERLRAVAESMHLTFSENDNSLLAERISHFHLFSYGHSQRIRNVIRGRVGDVGVTVFDYRYTVGSDRPTRKKQTVILFESGDMRLPAFSLRPEDVFHKVGQVFGYQDIDFDSHPTFSEVYLLRSDRESEVRDLFTPEVLSYFETQQFVSMEAAGGQLIFYEANRRLAPEQVPGFIREGGQ